MSEENKQKENVFSISDTLDINELASLSDDISPEFIEQLQNQVAQNASEFTGKPIKLDDTELFEETTENKKQLDSSADDNFIKKFKAKQNKQQDVLIIETESAQTPKEESINESSKTEEQSAKEIDNINTKEKISEPNSTKTTDINTTNENLEKISELTSGNIVERPLTQEQIEYNETLDFIDENVKYSKYVIYIDPENTDFIESLTVKERKNLINRILREQDKVILSQKRFEFIQKFIKHVIIAIVTVSISIPVVYWTINTSLEASINNYRRSQTIFKTLYREKGKIKKSQQSY